MFCFLFCFLAVFIPRRYERCFRVFWYRVKITQMNKNKTNNIHPCWISEGPLVELASCQSFPLSPSAANH